MPTLENEEIMAMKNTLSFLSKRLALEPSEGRKQEIKKDINELEKMIVEKLNNTSDFKDIKLEGDVY